MPGKLLRIWLGLICLAATPSHAQDAQWSVASGLEYSSGYYGQTERSESISMPFIFKYDTDLWGFKLHLPFIESDGPVNAGNRGTDGLPLPSKVRHSSGWGDPVFSASWAAYQAGGMLLDLGAKIKVATASVEDGLSTGENDYSLQADIYQNINSHTVFATLGQRKMGDPPGFDLRDPLFVSLGWSKRTSPEISIGIVYDYRQRLLSASTSDPLRECTAFLTWKVDRQWKLQSYVLAGFSIVSPDWGGGTMLFYSP